MAHVVSGSSACNAAAQLWPTATAQLANRARIAVNGDAHSLRLMRKARQMHAQQACKAKIQELTQANLALSSQVEAWESWYRRTCPDAIDRQVAVRLSAIAPVVRENVVAASCGRAARICGTARLRRNVASHVFSEDLELSNIGRMRQLQRGSRSVLNVWSMQADMVTNTPCCRAGALVVSSGFSDVEIDLIAEQSLWSKLLAQREERASRTASLLSGIVADCPDDGCELQRSFGINEWVNVQGRLGSIVRYGFDDYHHRVRVRWPHEANEWAAGVWVPLQHVSPLTFPARLTVLREIASATEPPVSIAPNIAGLLIDFDKEGDMVIRLDGSKKKTFVYLEDAHKFALW